MNLGLHGFTFTFREPVALTELIPAGGTALVSCGAWQANQGFLSHAPRYR
jgi:hypothetical protein